MKIRKRDAITIVNQLISDPNRFLHLRERLNRVGDSRIDINKIGSIKNFLVDYISSSDTYFTYYKVQDNKDIPRIPSKIVKFMNLLVELKKRKVVANNPAMTFLSFLEDGEIEYFPEKIMVYTYIVKKSDTLVLAMTITRVNPISIFMLFNWTFQFDSITLLNFENTTKGIQKAIKSRNIEIFNKLIGLLLDNLTYQNDFYDDLLLNDNTRET